MSESVGTGGPQEQPGRKARAGRWVRGRSARWVAVGAAVVVLGGGAAAAAIHHEEEGHGDRHRVSAADGRHHRMVTGGDEEAGGTRGPEDGRRGPDGEARDEVGAKAAPAPLPSLAAADALAKAQAAVAGGRVESLTTVAQQGGGRAWQAVVVGPDGVRHVVTVDGTSGALTGNTVLNG
ncbi:hypothetical protein [Streptomyces sp. NRRL B-24484]|uniref:hypothetical protein n=1 Tax=Streptomyces sp. NRRL B-24484 TaxID=1463833 RepID=UPI001331B94F|nr:hypothetical protein [Streptomyces sp. NRRL B-24484]